MQLLSRALPMLVVGLLVVSLLALPATAGDPLEGRDKTISGVITKTTGGGGSGSSSGGTVTQSGGGGGGPSTGPRITRNKRGIVYDYTDVGGGKMHYVFDKTRDYCHGSVNQTFCYGPKPKPVDGRPARRAPVPPPLTPTEVVERTIVNVQLPEPNPNIDPGYAVTGMKAYLETGSDRTHRFAPIDTVLGPLTITASSTYTVNWGDGSVTGPHSSSGGKYPDGNITHVYQDARTVDITVTQNWTAQWSLAGQSGTIGGLSSNGQLPNFVVREVQAVRRR